MTAPIELNKKLLNCDDYHRMINNGIFGVDEKLELLNGELIIMSPVGPKHGSIVNRLNSIFHKLIRNLGIISVQNPVTIPPQSEPEPDLAILKYRDDFYFDAHPTPSDVIIIIEVADSTINKDQTIKKDIYAQAAIPNFWIVNVQKKQLEIYSDPQNGVYKMCEIYLPGEQLKIEPFEIKANFDDLFGRLG